MEIVREDREGIERAVEVLERGGLVVYPTDTGYGIGADATSPEAVGKLMEFKGGRNKPISVVVESRDMAEEYVEISETGDYAYSFFPGKLTVVSRNLGKVDKRVAKETLGIRIPARDSCLEMAGLLGRPVTATSANPSGRPMPASIGEFMEIAGERKDMVDIAIDGGKLPGRPSTVVKAMERLEILREGELLRRDVKEFVSFSEADTERFAGMFEEPSLIALSGDLGSGKTAFARALGKRLGLDISSPTFNIVHEYDIPGGKFYHIDAYRMESWEELVEIGFYGMLKHGNWIVIEWADRVSRPIRESVLSYPSWWVEIEAERLDRGKRVFKYTSQFL